MDPLSRMVTLLAIIVWIAAPLHGQEGRWGSPDDPTVMSMIDMERMWASSSCEPQPALGDVIAADFQGTAPDGRRYGRAQAMETDTTYLDRDCLLGEVRVRFFGDSLALAYGNESSIRKNEAGKEKKHCLVWTDTWLRRARKWQIIAAQDTSSSLLVGFATRALHAFVMPSRADRPPT